MVTIQKKSAAQLVLETLRTYFQKDSVQVGDRFPTEKELCTSLGVGRGTVREAVKVLVAEGFGDQARFGHVCKSKTPAPTDSLSNWF